MKELEKGRQGFAPGFHSYCQIGSKRPEMGMDFGVMDMAAGDTLLEAQPLERAYVLVYGTVCFAYDGRETVVHRRNCFDDGMTALHVPSGVPVALTCRSLRAEVAVMRAENECGFNSRLYLPGDVPDERRGMGTMRETATRTVRTVLDKRLAPWSNLVLGEVITHPGRWSSYPPHDHPQPEIYYYKMSDSSKGYGYSELGNKALKIHNNDVLFIASGTHPQVAAPGYAMWYLWAIRHLEGEPYLAPNFVPEHLWASSPNAVFWPKKALGDWGAAGEA